MITLYGTFTELEILTIDLRRALLPLGLFVVRELDTETEAGRVRRLWVKEVKG